MERVVGIRFKRAGKLYFFDPGELELHMGDQAVVETARGLDMGEVTMPPCDMPEEKVVQPLKRVLRVATDQDRRNAQQNALNEKKAYEVGLEKIAAHKLEMKLVDVEYTFDNSKIIFYFTANGRIDFRALVKDLAGIFKTRIELRQIGVRDEAKMLGGLGPCGRQICCGAFLGEFQPVSIKMAKEQNLSLNPTKISGLCGRLMCCLKYEQDVYEQMRKRLPRPGKEVLTPDGVGIVLDVNVIKETVRARVPKGDGTEVKDYPAEDCTRPGPEHHRPERRAEDGLREPEEAPTGPRDARPPRRPQRGGRRDDAGGPQQARRPQPQPQERTAPPEAQEEEPERFSD